MSRSLCLLLLVGLVALSFTPKVAAFGAGNIPSFSYLEDKAFRHGDIEDVIATLFKAVGGGFLSRGTKFTPLDVKRVYFGNWLRDYSQAVDIAGLSKVDLQVILNVVMALGFLAHGYVSGEFEVTKDRLGCYLPVEHIDNPKGYGDGQDPRKFDPRLRGPIDDRELEVDPRTGMKNYIANENGNWDTSSAHVRRILTQCINAGRRARQSGRAEDEYEAFLLLGKALHTLEDFSAHSNWCELALLSLGYNGVFAHVGNNVHVRAPNGKDVPILVTGTFGGNDFIHSLMGEAGDHLSQASVSDLNKAIGDAQRDPAANNTTLRSMIFQLPGGDSDGSLSRDMDSVENMRAGQRGGTDPNTMSPQELYATMWKVLVFRDNVMKKIENTIDKIPGLGSLVEKITNSINVFVFTTLEPYLKPVLSQATSALQTGSQAVIDSHDQYEVFNDPNASDPTHSFLSKDHFALILNEPAGQIAKIIVEYTVLRVVKAWDDNSIAPQQVTDDVIQCMFHPDFGNGRSEIQGKMLQHMRTWIESTGRDKQEILRRLGKEAVRSGGNKRIGDTSTDTGHSHGSLPSGGLQGALAQHNIHVPGASILNAGQDLMAGKLPGQPGFGSGGPQAWRGNDAPAQHSYQQQQQQGHSSYQSHQEPQYQQQHHEPHYQQQHQQPQYQQQQQPQYQQHQSYEAPQQQYNPPQQQYNAPQQHYNAPQQPYQAPQHHSGNNYPGAGHHQNDGNDYPGASRHHDRGMPSGGGDDYNQHQAPAFPDHSGGYGGPPPPGPPGGWDNNDNGPPPFPGGGHHSQGQGGYGGGGYNNY